MQFIMILLYGADGGLNAAYQFIDELLKPEKTGKPFFISLSIAPLFPNGYGHARRFSCDAFGTAGGCRVCSECTDICLVAESSALCV